MKATDQLTIEPTPSIDERKPADAASSIKTILLHVQNDARLEVRLQVALSLARATGAHLRCLHVTPIQAYVAMDSLGGVFVMDTLVGQIDKEEAELRSTLENRLRGEDVAWSYEHVTADTSAELIRRAALSDIVVTGRDAHIGRMQGLELAILGDILTRVRTPLLIPGDAPGAFDPFGTAVIAWNGSYEAANAVRGAVGLLRLASSVRVVRITEAKDERFPSTVLLEYLSGHGVHAELDTLATDGDLVAGQLVEYAQANRASYVVMGGYGHSRAGEFFFGGVTRSLLKACPVALVVGH